MLCDDEPNILKSEKIVINSICKKLNKEVFITLSNDGLDCVHKLVEDYKEGIFYSILFIDQYMKNLDGLQAISLIKSLQYKKRLNDFPIYCVSGINEDESLLKAGAKGVLSKPTNKAIMQQALKDCGLLN